LRLREEQLFSGRTVIAPGADLRLDQVGLASEVAWAVFGPLVLRDLGDADAVLARTEAATRVLDEVMDRSWLVVHRAPTISPTSLVAFRPVRVPDSVIRLHPLVCEMLNADFDGDQVAVFLPVTEAGQEEAGERLSVAGHLARDPELLEALLPPTDAMLGLVELSLGEEGRREIAQLAGTEVCAPAGFITRVALYDAMREVVKRCGVDGVLQALERLTRRGFELAKLSGVSISAFIGAGMERPAEPAGDSQELWTSHLEEVAEQVMSEVGLDGSDLGPDLLAVKSGVRRWGDLALLIGPQGAVEGITGDAVIVRHGYGEGLTFEEMMACVAEARDGLAGWLTRSEQLLRDRRDQGISVGFSVVERARRARRPGVVFARAAAIGEVDPLTEECSRLLVGLPPI
jgi:hypothetical protein